jgi:hypothetical protein
MILAVINGGLGLQLANNTKDGKIIYGALAGMSACVYVAVVLSRRKTKAPFGFGKEKGGTLMDAEMTQTESPRAASS